MISPTLIHAVMATPSASPVASARRAAAFFRLRFGWNSLPSCRHDKQPAVGYAHLWDTPAEDAIIEHWRAPNIQVMTGCRWGLCVVDLDGELGVAAWESLILHRSVPRTWAVRSGSGRGIHLWFRTPPGVLAMPSRVLWDSGIKHNKIELLADNKLVVAPPSRYAGQPHPYRWLVGPSDLAEPAELPKWVLGLSPPTPPEPRRVFVPDREPMRYSGGGSFDRRDVLARLGAAEKLALAREWGLRLTGRVTRKGWHECHALGREDRRPSAGFHPESGAYREPFVRKVGFFDLAVELGRFATWQDCCNSIGSRLVLTA